MKTPPFELAPGEQVLDMAPALELRGITATSGRVWLTNQQLVFQPIVPWWFWIAPLVGLVFWLMNKSHWIHLPLVDITTRERTSFGRSNNVLRLVTRKGEHKLVIDSIDQFMGKLKEAA